MAHITDRDRAAIKAVQGPWIKACLERDWDSLLGMCTNDIEFFPPGAPKASGRQASRAFLEGFPVIKRFTFAFDKIEGRDDFAVGTGSFAMLTEVNGREVPMNGKFSDVFRNVGGTWLFQIVIFNTDHPMA
jgi:ketosteroid isomerase-like protein